MSNSTRRIVKVLNRGSMCRKLIAARSTARVNLIGGSREAHKWSTVGLRIKMFVCASEVSFIRAEMSWRARGRICQEICLVVGS